MIALHPRRNTPVRGSFSALVVLRERFADPRYEPPILPRTALELCELARKPETSFQDILRLLELDPILAARALRVAQSPLFARGIPAKSLEQALLRLGISTLTEIFLQVTLTSKLFVAPGFEAPMQALRRHSVATAHAARVICQLAHLPDEFAFLCGLLHDIGAVMSLIVVADAQPRHLTPCFDDIKEAIAEIHGEAGGVICDAWNLPAELKKIITQHHDERATSRSSLADILVVADSLASSAGHPSPIEDAVDADAARLHLGIFDGAYRRIAAEFAEVAQKIV